MIRISKDDESIGCLIQTITEDIGSGQRCDDDPSNIIEVHSFNQSGLFLSEEEVKKLEVWLNDYAEMMYHSGKTNRVTAKEDIGIAMDVGDFLHRMRTEGI